MKLKKIISLCLIGAMTVSLLTACGSTETESPTGDNSVSSSDESSTEEVFTGFKETQTIDIYQMAMYGSDGAEEVVDAINEISVDAINVKINYHPLDVASYIEQMSLMLAGGESADLLLTTAIPNVSFSTMQSQNQLLDISEYLEYYAPEMYELTKDYLAATTVNDAVYAIPCFRYFNSDYYILMRKDILDYLGLTEAAENIETWTDFESIMLKVQAAQSELPEELRTNAMIANSDSQGSIINGCYSNVAAEKLADAYGFDTLADSSKIIYVNEETNTVENYFASDDYRATIERVYRWGQEGLIYKDAATTASLGEEIIKNGASFSSVCMAEFGVETLKESEIGYPMVVCKYAGVPIQSSSASQWAWAVATTSENPEAAVAFLNLMYTNKDIENLFVYGIEGRDYDLNDAGEAVVREDGVYMGDEYFFGNRFNAYPPEGAGADSREQAWEAQEAAEISPYFGFAIDTSSIANEITAVSNVLTKYEPGLESGTLDPSNIDVMLGEMESAGVQIILDYYQEELDAWLAQQ